MELNKLPIESDVPSPFQIFLLTDPKIKKICKEFDFYNVLFYKEERCKKFLVYLQYPKGNLYWYLDFEKSIHKYFLDKEDCAYKEDFIILLAMLHSVIKDEFKELTFKLKHSITAKQVLEHEFKYQLRDYQAFDLCQFLIKYEYWNSTGLILSEPRTGKTRIALAAFAETSIVGDLALVICPKSAELGWSNEIDKLANPVYLPFSKTIITKISDLKKLESYEDKLNIVIISYDLFKKLTVNQIRQLTSRNKHITFIGDEIHRLRNFKTDQSKAIFNFKEFCTKDKVSLGIIGLTGTPAVKESYDVFGILSLINSSKIKFKPYYDSFNCFKEYFYYCEDTSFGKIAKALRREHELNYIIQMCSVQTKQKELSFFKNYKKIYKKISLDLDPQQKVIYKSVYDTMEYDEDIDCANKLAQLVRLQQICVDPYGLVASYEILSPKLKWIIGFIKKNDFKVIIASKKTKPIKHIMEVFNELKIQYSSLIGEYSYTERVNQIKTFSEDPNNKVMLLQLDTGREALTLPMAKATIFLDRDFAQGFNEQAEARMTPIDGEPCTKYIIDLVMKDTKEEQIYQTLVVKKQSIDAINTVFKSKKGD